MNNIITLDNILETLVENKAYHIPGKNLYSLLKKLARLEIEKIYKDNAGFFKFKWLGEIKLPYYSMGNVSSINLFDLDELIIFCFYWLNKFNYHKVIDIGANIGLHSIILAKLGYQVDAYEPEQDHFLNLEKNLALNNVTVKSKQVAVSNKMGEATFIKVLGNTTSSHIDGSKPNPYGDLEKVKVFLEPFNDIIKEADLIKMDVEGHEADILLSTAEDSWNKTDAIIEIGSEQNATKIYDHFQNMRVNLFSQKTGWKKVRTIVEMPMSYKEGSLFLSAKEVMPWRNSSVSLS
ncbi:MAG TPA: FkbM family methyltransferase [Gammaproteobacteria bacterium]|nr:FkbM family methyltransferase [Gammaproteobacteria bacterium]